MFARTLAAALTLALSAAGSVSAASAEGNGELMHIAVDHARVLKVERAAETIIVGNPAIMDIAVHDARTLILTGRSYGVTNFVVLDADGNAILDENVAVGTNDIASVRVFRQAQRSTYSCSPSCEPTVTVGDASEGFSNAASQFGTREGLARGAVQ